METEDKVRENRLRRMAKRLDLVILKSRARAFRVNDRGGYRVAAVRRNTPLAGANFELSMDDVEAFLNDYEAKLIAGKGA